MLRFKMTVLRMPSPFLLTMIVAVGLCVCTPRQSQALIDVWIDPGHGGTAPGTLGIDGDGYPNEQDFNFQVSEHLQDKLFTYGYFATHLTRDDSVFVSIGARKLIANGALQNYEGIQDSSQLFISIHMNAGQTASDSTSFGTETYYCGKRIHRKSDKDTSDWFAAYEIHEKLMQNAALAFLGCNRDRGVKTKCFPVLLGIKAPAILIEVCFISNRCQFSKIQSAGNQAIIAAGIAAGVTFVIDPVDLDYAHGPAMVLLKAEGAPRLPDRAEPCTILSPIYTCSSVPIGNGMTHTASEFQEGFEDTLFPPPGWNIQTTGAPIPHTWYRSIDPMYIRSGDGAAVVEGIYAGTIDEWLISPSVAITPGDRGLRFQWYGNRYWARAVNAYCYIQPAGSLDWTELWSLSSEANIPPFAYIERAIDISSWIGDTVSFAFRLSGIDGADFALDDIEIGDFEPTGPPDNDLCVNALELAGSFNASGTTCYGTNDVNIPVPPDTTWEAEMTGPDVWYKLLVAAGDSLYADISGGQGLFLVDDCYATNCLAWTYSFDTWAPDSILHVFAESGTYYLVVDNDGISCGPFEIFGELIMTGAGIDEDGGPVTSYNSRACPNPFGTSTTIAFDLPQSAIVSLGVYDVSGHLIKSLTEHLSMEPGRHSITWNATDNSARRVPPGIYFYRLKAGSHEEAGQMVLAN